MFVTIVHEYCFRTMDNHSIMQESYLVTACFFKAEWQYPMNEADQPAQQHPPAEAECRTHVLEIALAD